MTCDSTPCAEAVVVPREAVEIAASALAREGHTTTEAVLRAALDAPTPSAPPSPGEAGEVRRLEKALEQIIDYDDEDLNQEDLGQQSRYSGAMAAYRRVATIARAALAPQPDAEEAK